MELLVFVLIAGLSAATWLLLQYCARLRNLP
jgi:hypothetical protein